MVYNVNIEGNIKHTVNEEDYMRVITGSARGALLESPPGMNTRPTGEKVKEAVFSAIQFRIQDASVLDLFAGSGQLGIEALSRGARQAVFVDSCRQSAAVIRRNLQRTGFIGKSEIFCRDALSFLKSRQTPFDIVFADPPYDGELLIPVLENVKLNDSAAVICEYRVRQPLPSAIGSLALIKTRKYGTTGIAFYGLVPEMRKEDEQDSCLSGEF
ncbi:MAG: 16S rRNA (guanine(966)-N(2))-methyltransferase RsmD [Oscillospiraceae bacterium]|jgi:16S rRNA (guanine(966)-N(2))-methyltransferase RsmD|nr:16S rRNA (guanine(966)-N(2))-methyltransferase RsmD [Oscillospiraceae bacterium]